MVKVGDPMTFSWMNIAKSRDLNGRIQKYAYEYEIEFLDCTPEVKAERETKWGMKDGSCTKVDREFATITPYMTILGKRARVPHDIAYFDFYRRPKVGGYYVWERRSKLFKSVKETADYFTHNKKDYHRHNFTQIMDKDGKPLESYPRFIKAMEEFARENGLKLENMLFSKCPDSQQGCQDKNSTKAR